MNNNDRLRLPAAHRLRPLVITVAVFSLTSIMAGCYDANNERMYPYQFETVRSFGRGWVIADLNFDGSDEVIYRVRSTSETANEAWLFSNGDGRVVDQINLPGTSLTSPSILDFDGDGETLEVLIPVNRNDSVFAYIFNSEAEMVRQPIFIAAGEKRLDADGTSFNWEAEVEFYSVDVNDDGRNELISIVKSTFVPTPRGIYVHDPISGEELGNVQYGAAVNKVLFVKDYDADGKIELMVTTAVPNQGGTANDLSDDRGHVFLVELSESPTIKWSISAPVLMTQFDGFIGPIHQIGTQNLVLVTVSRRTTIHGGSTLMTYDMSKPLVRQLPIEIDLGGSVTTITAVDLDLDGILEVFALMSDHTLLKIDHAGIRQIYTEFQSLEWISPFPDVSGNGRPTLLLKSVTGRSALLNSDFDVIARPARSITANQIRMPNGDVLFMTSSGEAMKLLFNRAYLWRRYGDEAGYALILVLTIGFLRIGFYRGRSAANDESSARNVAAFQEAISGLFTDGQNPAKKALLVLENNYFDADFGVQQWAEQTGFKSLRQLERIIKKLTDQTPGNILWLRRISEGHSLLTSNGNDLTVSEVAYRVGFKEPSHFTKKYQTVMGQPPSKAKS